MMTDGKIACCRINYDDYVNFEIEEYKVKQKANVCIKLSY